MTNAQSLLHALDSFVHVPHHANLDKIQDGSELAGNWLGIGFELALNWLGIGFELALNWL